jgi:ribosomal protein S18 acetylase RimI-like enzyme
MAMIRAYAPRDALDVDRICVTTGAAGGDATGQFPSDDYLPELYARPYLAYAPELARVLDVDGVGGYVLGVDDTSAFVTWWRQNWRGDPDRMLIPELDEYPAHLHIDLEPRLQGSGWGRRLVEEFCGSVDAPGVHIAMDPANVAARAFYERLGFTELPSSSAAEPRWGLRLR